MRGFEVVDGGEVGGEVIICMVGLVLVMEWTSVLVIILHIPKKTKKKKDKKKKNRQTKYRKPKRESRVTKDHSTKYVVSLY